MTDLIEELPFERFGPLVLKLLALAAALALAAPLAVTLATPFLF